MLRWTIIFLVIAIIAAIFGFGGIAAGAAGIAKILFFIFLVLFVLSLIAGRGRGVADDVQVNTQQHNIILESDFEWSLFAFIEIGILV